MERLNWLEKKISPILESMGYEVVRVAVISNNNNKTLQIMVDQINGKEIRVSDCSKISKKLNNFFDSHKPIKEPYDLEVSSSGIDRPLTRLKDFSTFSGFETKLEMIRPIEGKKEFKGILNGIDKGNNISITSNGKEYKLSFQNILHAQLTLSDLLISKNFDRIDNLNQNQAHNN